MATINQLEKLGFQGNDANLEISLFEYRLAFRSTKTPDEYQFLYTNDGTHFDTGFLTKESFEKILDESWFNISAVCDYADTTKEELLERFPFSLDSIISYYGTENIFGSSYGGFLLKEFKPSKY